MTTPPLNPADTPCPPENQNPPEEVLETRMAETFAELSHHLADLNAQLLRRNQELAILNEISQALATTLHVEQQCAILYEQVRRILAAEVFYVAFYNETDGSLQSPFLMDQDQRYPGFLRPVNASSLAHQIAREQRPRLILRTPEELAASPPQTVPVGDTKRYSASLLFVPLLMGPQLIGVLSVQSYDFNAYTEADLKLLDTIAGPAALAFHNAQLWETAEQRRRDVEAADRLKSEFLANISHELRTPLTPIITAASMLRDKADRLTEEEVRENGAVIVWSAQRLKQLLDDLLDLVALDAGKLYLHPTLTDLNELVQSTLEQLRPGFEAKAHTVTPHLRSLPRVLLDRQRLRQVLWNLADNAIKYTPSEGKIIVETTHDSPTGEVRVTITDSGIGLSPESQQIVFERFRQVDGSSTREVGGLGLGLELVRRLVELHGGQVWVESAGLQQGSTFGFTLPVKAVKS